MIPPGCCPVVLFVPVQPFASTSSSELEKLLPVFSSYFFTYPKAVFSAIVATVPALKIFSSPNISPTNLWAIG